jgi:glucose/arabinose dehydrogenase
LPAPSASVSTAPLLAPAALAGQPADVTTGLEAPWSIAFVGDTALISERDSARILELAGDGSTREVGVVEGVRSRGEGGLLGLAVDADDRLYVYSTVGDGNRIQRYDLTGAPGSFGLSAPVTLLAGLPAAGNHNGGRLAFGPDGLLYASVGDAGQPANAQNPTSLSGKILRMTADGGIPPGNPDPASLVYSSGHRNVQGMGWAQDGTMFASEFGQDTWDELNIIVAGGNYGWPDAEGIAGVEGFIDPVQQWHPDSASPSGLVVIGGTVFVANLRGEVLRGISVTDPTTSIDYFAGQFGRIRDVIAAPDGALWFVTNNTDGRGDARDGDDRVMSVAVTR